MNSWLLFLSVYATYCLTESSVGILFSSADKLMLVIIPITGICSYTVKNVIGYVILETVSIKWLVKAEISRKYMYDFIQNFSIW